MDVAQIPVSLEIVASLRLSSLRTSLRSSSLVKLAENFAIVFILALKRIAWALSSTRFWVSRHRKSVEALARLVASSASEGAPDIPKQIRRLYPGVAQARRSPKPSAERGDEERRPPPPPPPSPAPAFPLS